MWVGRRGDDGWMMKVRAPWPRKGNPVLTYQIALDFSSPSSSFRSTSGLSFVLRCLALPRFPNVGVALVPCPQLSATDLTHASHRSCLTLTALSDHACTSTPSKFGPSGSALNARRRNVVVVSRVVFSLYFWYKCACRVAVVSCRELVAMAVTNRSRLW